jgi:hypothetical protein
MRIRDDFSAWEKHRQIHVVSYGNLIREEVAPEGLTTRTYHGLFGPVLTVVITLQLVFHRDLEPYGEIRYSEGRADFSLTRINPDRPLNVLEPVRKALRVVYGLKARRGGSPKGPRKAREWDRDRILAWYSEAGDYYAREGLKVELKDLAEAMRCSVDTASRRLRKAGLGWPPTDDDLEELDDDP